MLKLYQAEWCPYCRHVREWISQELNDVPIVFISVPRGKTARQELRKISGQTGIPTLIDEEAGVIIPDDDDKIIDYLKKKFKIQ